MVDRMGAASAMDIARFRFSCSFLAAMLDADEIDAHSSSKCSQQQQSSLKPTAKIFSRLFANSFFSTFQLPFRSFACTLRRLLLLSFLPSSSVRPPFLCLLLSPFVGSWLPAFGLVRTERLVGVVSCSSVCTSSLLSACRRFRERGQAGRKGQRAGRRRGWRGNVRWVVRWFRHRESGVLHARLAVQVTAAVATAGFFFCDLLSVRPQSYSTTITY